ncbi:MAG: heparinase II/III family protein [Actinomycetota bacterium]|nr:heparinase II/III family protein [Actinomycetota bacterium]
MTSPSWYLRRLSRMGPDEVLGRVRAAARIRRWRALLDEPVRHERICLPQRWFTSVLGPDLAAVIAATVADDAKQRLIATAERLMDGHAEFFGVPRSDLVAPDWAFDPGTGQRAPADAYAFDIDHRDEQVVGDIKQLWELSRHHHLTVLAAAFAVTGDDRYACRVADHLKSWWAANPPLRGVHWLSGIELGIRLLSWVWVRRLLDAWPGAPGLFERNPEALHQIHFHQRWLSAFPSIGSSGNNHVIAEAAGQLAAACAFPWFHESGRWRADAMRLLDEQLQRNTFPSGLNRELATEYHGLVLELGLTAAIEADAANCTVPGSTWLVLQRMVDALAAIVDVRLRPPRQGDGDDGHGLVVDGEGSDRWTSLLATGEILFGRPTWWPQTTRGDVRTALLTALAQPRPRAVRRPVARPYHFADAGLTILRVPHRDDDGEIWCRCDGGPHGFLSIAAHAHADALSLEVRHDGVEILADPGTFSYGHSSVWRSYSRSTLGHNTLELDGDNQSTSGGPFMWTQHARSRVLGASMHEGGVSRWTAEHDGYSRRGVSALHRRSVELDSVNRELKVVDEVMSPRQHRCRLMFHLGPEITADLSGDTAQLRWTHASCARAAALTLPAALSWTSHRGELTPPLGWYSAGLGRRQPAVTLLGSGFAGGDAAPLMTLLCFHS